MKVLLLGGTGSLGSSVLNELIENGHAILALALARSAEAEEKLAASGAEVLRGDIRSSKAWAPAIHRVDAIIHLAATFTQDMGEIDRNLIDTLINEGRKTARKLRFIYTGGVWLYGKTGDSVATETSPFNPPPNFSWMIGNGQRVMKASCFISNIIHPALVYDREGGAFSRFLAGARTDGQIEVYGPPETRWPLVHCKDMASAYRLVLESNSDGEAFNAATQEAVRVGQIATTLTRRLGLKSKPAFLSKAEAIHKHGEWAIGPLLDQQMSSQKIINTLHWQPKITDALAEIR